MSTSSCRLSRQRWGQFSVVNRRTTSPLKLLYRSGEPDWFVLISAADYPTMSAARVLDELTSNKADALLDYRAVPTLTNGSLRISAGLQISRYSVDIGKLKVNSLYIAPENPSLKHFVLSTNLGLAWRRYIGLNFLIPVIRKGPRIGRYTLHLPFEDPRSPFTPDFECFYGDHWFTGNHKVADTLLRPTDKHVRLRRHLSFRHNVDECYYQTVLANSRDLNISRATRRFADWSSSAGGSLGGSHPKPLSLDDLSAIMSSKCHFARKFAPNSPVLDELDKILK